MKFEDFRTFQNFIQKGSYMFNFDFKSDYHHIDIFGEHFYKGLPCSGQILENNGIKIVIFIDDGIAAESSYEKCKKEAYLVKHSIKKSGFVVNSEKTNWVPTQQVIWLGLEINTKVFSLRIKEKRRGKNS